MQHSFNLSLLVMLLFLTACGVEPTPPPSPDKQAKIDKAKAAIMAEPQVKDAFFDHTAPIQWHVGVMNNGSDRSGYALYLCSVLDEHDVAGKDVKIRVVDVVKVVNQNVPFNQASLGMADCETFEIINW